MRRIKDYLLYVIGALIAYGLRPPFEVLERWFHELGHALYQWVGTSFSEFPKIIFFNRYMRAYYFWLGEKILLYGKDLPTALRGSYVDHIVGSAAPPSREYKAFLHAHPLEYAKYSAAGPLLGAAYSTVMMLLGLKAMRDRNPICKAGGAMLSVGGIFGYIQEALWAIHKGQDYWLMDFYGHPMDDMVKAIVLFLPPSIFLVSGLAGLRKEL